ncbi:MAG: hypothetical protein M1820_007631 [Bogoriella megaspora]|nr:MAG: hypothetical protein M1820_007631 [Bogoriella megaspora]
MADFDALFEFDISYAFPRHTYEEINDNRRTLGNKLFFDRLLEVLNIAGKESFLDSNYISLIPTASDPYPPKTNKDLRELHHAIVNAQIAEHYKQSLLYYILRDCKDPNEPDRSLAYEFANANYLPERYWIYVSGLWELDHLQFRNALEELTDPSLIPTFSEEIFATLLRHAKPEDRGLALAYYHTVSPPILDDKVREEFLEYLVEIGVIWGHNFAKEQPEPVHRHLFELLISSCLRGGESGDARAVRCMALINLVLDEDEERWFEEYLLEGEGRYLHGAKDTVMVRKIAMGRTNEALREGEHLSGRKTNGYNWDTVRSGLTNGIGARAETYKRHE